MNIARDFALEKAVKKVEECLSKFAGGVYLSQITSHAGISNDLARRALSVIGAEEDESSLWNFAELKVSPAPAPAPAKPKTLVQRVIEALEKNPNGLTLAEITAQAECNRSGLDGVLCYIRKNRFPVRLQTCDDGQRRYVPGNSPAAELAAIPDTSTPVMQETPKIMQDQPETILSEAELIHEQPKIMPKTTNPIDPVASLFGDIVGQIAVTQTVTVSRAQVEEVLKKAFGYDDIRWNFKHGLSGATMTKQVRESANG